jgi:glycosyltransferase involved in cell wall biosynthesis
MQQMTSEHATLEPAAGAPPTRVELFVPANDDPTLDPEVSIVVPALNEQITIGEFVDWCKEGLQKAGVRGEILIVDSSSDQTPHIALQHGARVLRTPKGGLGRAYIDAIPFIRGSLIIMGDCDLTYDFREIGEFVARYREGYEFIMGSRFLGSIEPDAMPKLHRYFGTPLTTWIMNSIYHTRFTDIHCGMRGLTKSALQRIDLHSQSWEYASEMVLKASRLRLRIAEVPVSFFKDREGRLSHLKRGGILAPWSAGWINLKVMLVYTPDSFLLKPGLALFVLAALLTTSLAHGGYFLGPVGLDLHWMLLGMTLAVLGYGSFQIGMIARLHHQLRIGVAMAFAKAYSYDRGMIAAALLTGVGILFDLRLLAEYVGNGYRLLDISYYGVFGLFLIIMGFQTFTFTLSIEMMKRFSRV